MKLFSLLTGSVCSALAFQITFAFLANLRIFSNAITFSIL